VEIFGGGSNTVISCIMFADGSFSSLNEFTKEDCESLESIEKTKK
jgi:hypothetical protein